MNLGTILYRRSDRYIDAGRKTPLSLTAIFLLMPRDLWCHLGDMGHSAHATGNEALSSPWSLGTVNEEGREAILREISPKQLRWLDWHTRESCSPSDLCGGCYGKKAGCFSNVAVKRQCCQGHLKMCAPLHSSAAGHSPRAWECQSLGFIRHPLTHNTPSETPPSHSSSLAIVSNGCLQPHSNPFVQHSSLVQSVL